MITSTMTTERRQKPFLEAVQQGIVVSDGAMGTMLYSRGIFLNRCFDELNLSNAKLIEEIHADYLRAGAQVLTTNTFGANRFKLQANGLEDRVLEINRRGAEIARGVAEGRAWVAGSVGPTGALIQPIGQVDPAAVRAAFREQVQGLVEGGVDLIAIETFSSLEEMGAALAAVREVTELPVVASFSFDRHGLTNAGLSPEEVVPFVEEHGADVVGCNCSTGPNDLLEVVEAMARVAKRPLVTQPNAGMPREVEGRLIFLATPEYMAEYARRFILAGASVVGGCCGTTPAHIKEILKFVRQLVPMKEARQAAAEPRIEAPPVPEFEKQEPAEKTPFGAKLGRQFVVSVEIDPPRGIDPVRAVAGAKMLTEKGVDVINIADGPRASARMSPFALAVLM
ncbi:MAG: homocysteine S-methyltransferase family protein, partial [Candidatus Eiseniibacteriota bacterium]